MGKKGVVGVAGAGYGSNKKPPTPSGLLYHGQSHSESLRQQAGRGGGGGGGRGAVTASAQQNPSIQASALRAEHLLRLATWASAAVPPLGALLGARLGCLCEAAGVPVPDTPHSICERCESVMQVGINCSVRVTKNKKSGKSCNAGNVSNFVTYICHFCKHGNSKPGTGKNHLKTKISQVAARSNLDALGKSSAAEMRSGEQKASSSDLTKKGSSGLEYPKSADMSIDKGLLDITKEGSSGQEDLKAVDMGIDKGLLDIMKEGSSGDPKSVDINIDKGLLVRDQQESAEREDAKYLEIRDDRLLNLRDRDQQGSAEQEGPKSVEMSVNKGRLDILEKSEQGLPEQDGSNTVEFTLTKEPLDLLEKNQHECAEQEGSEFVEINLTKEPLDITEKKLLLGFADEEDPRSVVVSLNSKPLDLTSKKKRKKNQQASAKKEVPRSEGPRSVGMSLSKVPAVESIDSTKKKKRKGWSTLRDLASAPK